jgi:hypothetical protein
MNYIVSKLSVDIKFDKYEGWKSSVLASVTFILSQQIASFPFPPISFIFIADAKVFVRY